MPSGDHAGSRSADPLELVKLRTSPFSAGTVKISPRDVDQVYFGQTATMRFAAFNQKTTPEVEGAVTMVSADLTQDQRTGASYYMVRVALKPEELEKLGASKVVPGMPVDVFIKTTSRTALSYLTKPLRDQAEKAFKER